MAHRSVLQRVHPLWWTGALVVTVVGLMALSIALFSGKLSRSVPVMLTSDRAGLVMYTGARVKLRGVEVGHVAAINTKQGGPGVRLQLNIDRDQIKYIPANVGAQIKATTAFGTKYVDLIYPDDPSPKRLTGGQVLQSRNVSTEVNTVFQDLVDVLHQIDPQKLNGVLSALAEGVRGQGERIGEATTAANEVLIAYNDRMDTIRQDWRSFKAFNDAYAGAADHIVSILDAATTTSATISSHESALNALLLNTTGLAHSGINLIGPNAGNLISGLNGLQPTTDLLMKYNPEYTCLLVGAKNFIDNGGRDSRGGNGYSLVIDSGLLFGDDAYRYPDNLPIVAAKGGPGGKPGCGSLPDARKNFPVRALVTNTGWGTGLDIRPNPGIGHPWFANYFPATRAVPEFPYFLGVGPPAIGPIPYPGAPPYGAPLYGPDGTPLYPGVPPPPPAPDTEPAPPLPPPPPAPALDSPPN
ncbi:MAG: phospholipid/cholesterol/gamma-HCH transport system substrate-binding protein [Mycobacterium sp.]|nr:phospholipid/cholesterol/gamma-HCH transport system substrate-binding protein [Mycobacterium sp.]